MGLQPTFGNRFRVGALGMTALLAVLLSGCGGTTYSCGNGQSGHCYGVVKWTGNPTGFSMELTAVALTSGDIFVDDEGWLVDYFKPGDPIAGAYWVETGEINEGFGTEYFWADNTADWGFEFYDLGPVAAADTQANTMIAYKVNQDAQTSSTWNVTISKAAGGLLYKASSTDNPMSPNTIIEGQELAGSQNAQAPLAFFTYNAAIQGSTTTLRTSDGTVEADHPPNAGWWVSLAPSQTGNGGWFFTDCC